MMQASTSLQRRNEGTHTFALGGISLKQHQPQMTGKFGRSRQIETRTSNFAVMHRSSRRGFIFLAGLLVTASPAQAFFFTETSNEGFFGFMAMMLAGVAFPVCVMLLALSLSEKSRPLLKKCAWFPGGIAVLTFVSFLQAGTLAELLFFPMAHAGLAVIMNRLGGM